MSVSQNLVIVNVTKGTAIPSRASFGTILFAAYHTIQGTVLEFGSIDEVESAGFTSVAWPAINRAMTVMFSQSPRPSSIKLGKRVTGSLTQIIEASPIVAQGTGFIWTIVIDGLTITYPEAPADTPTLIVAGLLSAVNLSAATVTASSPVVTTLTLTSDVTNVVHSYALDALVFDLDETTLDPGITTDLTAIQGLDEDWSFLVLDSNSPAEIAAAATWIEARIKMFGADAYLSDVADSLSTTDICSVLALASRERTFTYRPESYQTPNPTSTVFVAAYYAAAYIARVTAAFPIPGRATWHFQTLAAVTGSTKEFPQGRQAVFVDKRTNFLVPKAAGQRSINGVVAAPQFIDTIWYVDYLAASIKFVIENALANQTDLRGKVPFTDPGIASIKGVIAVFVQGETTSDPPALASLPAPIVTVPAALDVPVADRAERVLTGVQVTARYAGAIQEVRVQVFLEV